MLACCLLDNLIRFSVCWSVNLRPIDTSPYWVKVNRFKGVVMDILMTYKGIELYRFHGYDGYNITGCTKYTDNVELAIAWFLQECYA